MDTAVLGFPLAYAKTQRFSLGVPRSITVSDDGEAVTFLRSVSGTSPTLCLWVLDVESGTERMVVDPAAMSSSNADEELTAEERARRERARESAAGIVRYSLAERVRLATFVVGGSVYVASTVTGQVREIATAKPAFDARFSPDGRSIAYACEGTVRVVRLGSDAASDRDVRISPDDGAAGGPGDGSVSWGLAEFVAAEEMGRTRGFWWSPTSDALLMTRVDLSAVAEWTIADPANPAVPATTIHYPAAGTTNAGVQLFHVPLEGPLSEIPWQQGDTEYLADLSWNADGALIVAQPRDQRTTRLLTVDPGAGTVSEVASITDGHWTELHPGAPRFYEGSLYTIEDLPDRRALCVDRRPVTDPDMQVRSLVAVNQSGATITASLDDPTEVHVFHIPEDGWAATRLTDEPGVHSAVVGGPTTVVASATPGSPVTQFTVRSGEQVHTLRNVSQDPWLRADAIYLRLGPRHLASALFLPSDHDGATPLPVLLDPYGGPHAQRVLKSHNPHLVSRWFAEQGFAVLVTDGRGTPGRGPAFEREVWGDLAAPVLEDQLDALDAAAVLYPFLDLDRVGIRGWSFGGYLAALAALRAPERIHAAVAGAPVTDWRLYDTHYTERYLGHPDQHPENYERSSLLNEAEALQRPLLLIHGLADDNVVAAHSLQFSSALLAHGRAHQVLPLSGVTHMTPQAVVSQNLLLLQLEFLNQHLADRSREPA